MSPVLRNEKCDWELFRSCFLEEFRRGGGRIKGQVAFQGFGLIERAELVTQLDPKGRSNFTNYRFDFAVLTMNQENADFSWSWINARRDSSKSPGECMRLAPFAWLEWVNKGSSALPGLRRSVASARLLKREQQLPQNGSREADVLAAIRAFYPKNREHRFEVVAELVAQETFDSSSTRYTRGWVTKRSGDGGWDFVGRMDIGTGMGTTKLVVLGQAKCESDKKHTSGLDVARTVARLRRGWLGVYVTTSYFSDAMQREVVEDEYPIALIEGGQVAQSVLRMAIARGLTAIEFLKEMDGTYESRVAHKDPSMILLD